MSLSSLSSFIVNEHSCNEALAAHSVVDAGLVLYDGVRVD